MRRIHHGGHGGAPGGNQTVGSRQFYLLDITFLFLEHDHNFCSTYLLVDAWFVISADLYWSYAVSKVGGHCFQ